MKKPQDRIFLVGPMGSGKTTIGRHLAKALKLEFIDSDHAIEQRTGADIPWIFDIEGEQGFRRRERAVIDPRNRADLAAHGIVVYLQASAGKILSRTAKSQNRPLLKTEDPRARVEELLAAREPLYREIADIIVDTDKRGIRSTVNLILERLRHTPAGSGAHARKPRLSKDADSARVTHEQDEDADR